MAVKVLFAKHNRVNQHEQFQWRAEFHDRKFHQSSRYIGHKVWRTWRGGYKLRGHTHQIFNPCFHQRYNPPMASRRIRRMWSGDRNSMTIYYGIHALREKLTTSFS